MKVVFDFPTDLSSNLPYRSDIEGKLNTHHRIRCGLKISPFRGRLVANCDLLS